MTASVFTRPLVVVMALIVFLPPMPSSVSMFVTPTLSHTWEMRRPTYLIGNITNKSNHLDFFFQRSAFRSGILTPINSPKEPPAPYTSPNSPPTPLEPWKKSQLDITEPMASSPWPHEAWRGWRGPYTASRGPACRPQGCRGPLSRHPLPSSGTTATLHGGSGARTERRPSVPACRAASILRGASGRRIVINGFLCMPQGRLQNGECSCYCWQLTVCFSFTLELHVVLCC